jgi:predicted MPP superfamily phosphohydrolase
MNRIVKKQITKLLLLVALMLVSSCAKTYLNFTTRNARELKVFEKEKQTIVFIAMTHIAKPYYFEQVKAQIDLLRNEGFIFVKEGVYYEKDTEPQQRDTLQLKMRQLLGFSIGDYSNKENKTLPNFLKNGKYVMQRDSIIG